MEFLEDAKRQFGELILSELERIRRMKAGGEPKDFSRLDKIVVGVMPGDGIGPIIMKQALRVLETLMKPEIESGKIEIRHIEGMTIENRGAVKGPYGDAQSRRSMAQPDFRQQHAAPVSGFVCGGAPHQDSGEGHRLDFLPGEY